MSDVSDGGRLAEELRALLSDAEALLRTSTGAASPAEHERAEATLVDLRARLNALEQQVKAHVSEVDSYVRDNPWQAVAVVGGIALLLGLIMGRR
jgi:ElaB/YqjD/DUF883 family membrane-anchored ribosome-binding protein